MLSLASHLRYVLLIYLTYNVISPLGNHDYRFNPDAQILYTDSKLNDKQIWNMPDRNYHFSYHPVHFFGLDTNGCQGAVRLQYPSSKQDLHNYIELLDMDLKCIDDAQLKIVFGHHPMYTRGKNHSVLGKIFKFWISAVH